MRKSISTPIGYLGIETSTGLPWVGISFDIGSYEGDEITLGLYFYFFSVWLKYSDRKVYKLCALLGKLHRARFTRSYNSYIHIALDHISIGLLGDHVGEDALLHRYINLERLLKGNAKCTVEILRTGDTEVVMPEGAYKATYTIERRTWTYPRWFTRHRTDIDLKILNKGGIPHMGKGENSWDCGMDGTYGICKEYKDSIREATDYLAMSVLKERQRYSSLDMYSQFTPVTE